MKPIYQLPNGKCIDLVNYEIVLFIQSDSIDCRHFNPKFNEFSQQLGIRVAVFSLDGKGDETFPEARAIREDIFNSYFTGLDPVTPTTFLLDRVNDKAELLSQGDMSMKEFKVLLNDSLLTMAKLT